MKITLEDCVDVPVTVGKIKERKTMFMVSWSYHLWFVARLSIVMGECDKIDYLSKA